MDNNTNFNTTVLDNIIRNINNITNKTIKVGLIGNIDSEILQRGFFTEFGNRRMPGWRWLYRTFSDSNTIREFKLISKRIFLNLLQNRDINLDLVGVWAEGATKNYISNIWTPALSPITITLKRSSKPLIDTGQMRNSISYKIE